MHTISRHIIVEEIEGKIVLFDSNKLLFYNLNETATYFFHLLQKKKELKEIAQLTAMEFDTNPKQIEKDLNKLIMDLEKKGIIRKRK